MMHPAVARRSRDLHALQSPGPDPYEVCTLSAPCPDSREIASMRRSVAYDIFTIGRLIVVFGAFPGPLDQALHVALLLGLRRPKALRPVAAAHICR